MRRKHLAHLTKQILLLKLRYNKQKKENHPSPSFAIMNPSLITTLRRFTKESVMAINTTADVTQSPHLMIKQRGAGFTGGFFWKTISHHSHQPRKSRSCGHPAGSLRSSSFFQLFQEDRLSSLVDLFG